MLIESNGKIKKGLVPRADLLKEKNAVAFCDLKDFDSKIRKRNLIKVNKFKSKADAIANNYRKKGIPQGSPISATLANINLYEFDYLINKHIISLGGVYRRYSDDMVVVVNEVFKDEVYNLLIDKIKDFDLEIQPAKSQIFYFKKFTTKFTCKELNRSTNTLSENTRFEYLGFAFDGETVYLKSAGLSKYYRKMKRTIRRGGFYAKNGKNQIPKLFKNRLYKRYTIVGANRRMIVKKLPHLNKFIRTGEYDWGNFLTYALLSARVFQNNKIKSQIKNHWRKFHELVKAKQAEIDTHYTKLNKKV